VASAPDAATQARYVAIITDGNGRWAQREGVSVEAGHSAGADTVKARLRDAVDFGVRELTVYSFSTENWSRAPEEVAGLMRMHGERIEVETPELHEEGVRMRFVGRREGIEPRLVERMAWAEELTGANDRITLFVAFNYGGRAEIVEPAANLVPRDTRLPPHPVGESYPSGDAVRVLRVEAEVIVAAAGRRLR